MSSINALVGNIVRDYEGESHLESARKTQLKGISIILDLTDLSIAYAMSGKHDILPLELLYFMLGRRLPVKFSVFLVCGETVFRELSHVQNLAGCPQIEEVNVGEYYGDLWNNGFLPKSEVYWRTCEVFGTGADTLKVTINAHLFISD